MTGPGGPGLSGRVAVVTGGHDGVGCYITEALLGEGMRVALLARRKEVLQQAARKLAGDVLPVVCDIRDPDSVRAAFASVDEGLGSVSVLAVQDTHVGGSPGHPRGQSRAVQDTHVPCSPGHPRVASSTAVQDTHE